MEKLVSEESDLRLFSEVPALLTRAAKHGVETSFERVG